MGADIIAGHFCLSPERKQELLSLGAKVEGADDGVAALSDPAPAEKVIGHTTDSEEELLRELLEVQRQLHTLWHTQVIRGLEAVTHYFKVNKGSVGVKSIQDALSEHIDFRDDAGRIEYCKLTNRSLALTHVLAYTAGDRLGAHHLVLGFRTQRRIVVAGKRLELPGK